MVKYRLRNWMRVVWMWMKRVGNRMKGLKPERIIEACVGGSTVMKIRKASGTVAILAFLMGCSINYATKENVGTLTKDNWLPQPPVLSPGHCWVEQLEKAWMKLIG